MNIGPSTLKDAETMLGGPCVAIPMLMLLKKQSNDNDRPPISFETMTCFVDQFNHSNYSGKRPEILMTDIKGAGANVTYRMIGVVCRQFEKTKRLSYDSFYWMYTFEGFFIPVRGIWGGKQYNLSMRRIAVKRFEEYIHNNMVYVLRGNVTKNKESNRIWNIEFYRTECFNFEKVIGIVNHNNDW